MAPLRSSRSTRNQDHQAAARNRPGVVDLDPTEGLPVQKWEQVVVRVNQDPSSEPNASNALPSGTTATSSAEWAAQFNTPQFPWPEKPLPSFFNQLPPWNQEMLRRARAGNTNAKLSVWDRKTNSWISAAEAEKRQNPLKSVHLNNLDQSNGSKQENAGASPAHDDEDDHDEKSDDEVDGDNAEDDVGPTVTSGSKKRKKYTPEERLFEVKQWKQVPSAVADKTEERKFLADRRPGMPSLYGGAYQNQVFGSMGLNTNGYGFSAANAGYDLGDGGGLGNAGGMLGPTEGAATPVRKNMPPKRKKKKGGPGRKKANPDPTPQTDANGSQANGSQGIAGGNQGLADNTESKPTEDVSMVEGDNEGSDSGSEADGSEEGEIDEGGHDEEKQNGIAEKHNKILENTDSEQQTPAINEDQMAIDHEPNDTITTDTEIMDATLDASNNESEPQMSMEAADVAMQEDPNVIEQPTAEISQIEQPEPETIPSIIQPPPSEQIPGTEPVDLIPAESQSVLTEIPSMIPSDPEFVPQVHEVPSQPEQPQVPSPDPLQDQPTENVSPVPAEPAAMTIPSLDAIPVQPTTQLPPITTAVAESMDQPSISASGGEPTAVPSAPQNAVPEPTSPDLLGGLEDALNKNMDEHGAE